jgi:hypothetical protein
MATVREVEVMDETAQDPEAGLPALADARGGACGARVARTSAGPRDRGRSGCRRVGQAPRRPLSSGYPSHRDFSLRKKLVPVGCEGVSGTRGRRI